MNMAMQDLCVDCSHKQENHMPFSDRVDCDFPGCNCHEFRNQTTQSSAYEFLEILFSVLQKIPTSTFYLTSKGVVIQQLVVDGIVSVQYPKHALTTSCLALFLYLIRIFHHVVFGDVHVIPYQI